jgi:type I restriction enzyme M protein
MRWWRVRTRIRCLRKKIEKNDFNLNIALYVQIAEEEETIDVKIELEKLKELQAKREVAEKKMIGFLEELGYEA